MSEAQVSISRTIPIQPGRKPAAESISVVLPTDQPPLQVIDATALVSDVKASMFGFPLTEQRQFLLQELPNYGINTDIWYSSGSFRYDPDRSAVELTLSNENTSSTHQTKFAYKYQPGKQISISQAVECSIGAAIANSFIQWGEFTKKDGYGWRVLSKQGSTSNGRTIWYTYLYFFRRTSALPYTPSLPGGNVTLNPGIDTSGVAGIQVGESTLYRPAYLVGNGTNTTYLDANAWEELAYTSMEQISGVSSSSFNKDKFTGRNGEGTTNIDGQRKTSGRKISYIAESYQYDGVSISAGTSINLSTASGLTAGMSVRGEGVPAETFITSILNNTINLNKAVAQGTGVTLYINERANLCMFLIQRSWYGGAGGKGLIYAPDSNSPYNGGTRWQTGHEIRIGDTLPVPSMSAPDMPITYNLSKRLDKTNTDVFSSTGAFLRRYGVSVWIDGGDPRPARIESANAVGVQCGNTSYKPILAIGIKPFVLNVSLSGESAKRPQKSRAYPISLYISATQNTEIYMAKGESQSIIDSFTSSSWWNSQDSSENFKAVARIPNTATGSSFNTNSIPMSNGYPTLTNGVVKLFSPFYCGANDGNEIELTEIFDPQRELLGRAEAANVNDAGDVLFFFGRCLTANQSSIVSLSIIYGVQ